jgi:ParB-like chromosome segregation protein Spo0J
MKEIEPRAAALTKIRISKLRLDFQLPEHLIEEGVGQYVEILRNGQVLPPIYVRFDGVNYFLQDGFHRVEAAKREGIEEVDAEIAPGTLDEMESEFRDSLSAALGDLRSRKL